MSLIKFINEVARQIQDKQNKGNFEEWRPDEEELVFELSAQLVELQVALRRGRRGKIREHSTNITACCYKAYKQFGVK